MREGLNQDLITPVQDERNNPTLTFCDGQILHRSVMRGGTTVERFISWAALREAATGIAVDSGWLAPAVARWGTGKRGDWVVAFLAPARHSLEITIGDTPEFERITTPLPGIVIFGMANKYFVYAVKQESLDPQKELYRCPLPNVYADGEICWGNLKPPQATPRTVLKAWELFIGSTFNNHAANGKSARHDADVRVMLRDLAAGDAAVYPVTDLRRQSETGVTLDRALKHFFHSGEMPA